MIKKNIENAELIFKIWFLLYTMISVCNIFYGKTLISFVMWPMMCVGALLVVNRIVHYKEYIKMPGLFILILFLVSFGVSIVVNYKYGLKDNIVTFVLWCFYFCILFARRKNESKIKLFREFEIIGCIYIIYASIGFLCSLIMMVYGYSHVYTNKRGYEVAAGFIWGRLWGVFIDPNSSAVMATAVIFLLIYYMKKSTNKLVISLMSIDVLICILYIAFSDSRTGRVCFGISAFFYTFLLFIKKNRKRRAFNKVCSFFVALLIAVGAFYLPKVIVSSYNFIQTINAENSGDEAEKIVERGYDIENDVSNRRFDIWKSGIEIYKNSPILGVSFGGLRAYAEEKLPDTYIVNNDYKDFNTLDNDYLNVLVSQGTVGGILLICFIIVVLRVIQRNIMCLKPDDFLMAVTCFSIVTSIAVSAMFRAAMFYHSSPNANMFWSFLGILLLIINGRKEIEDEQRN